MHRIMRLDPSTRSGVRDQIYRALADYASGGNHGPISIVKLFWKAAKGLVEANIIERPRLSTGYYSYDQLTVEVSDAFPNYGIHNDIADLMRQTLWELYLQGVLAPAPRKDEVATGRQLAWLLDLREFMLTPYGVDVLTGAGDRIRVHDPDGYLANFWNARPEADPEMMRYLVECVHVFRGGHLLASVVLLGIASERLIEILAMKLRDALELYGGVRWFQDKYLKTRDISGKFKAIESKLMSEYSSELDKEGLKDGFQTVVRLTFEVIRNARNDIAHPKGRDFTWNEVNGLLFNFVPYFKHISRIIAFLADHPRL